MTNIHVNPINAGLFAFPRITFSSNAIANAASFALSPDVYYC
jgi:hypothetical protein